MKRYLNTQKPDLTQNNFSTAGALFALPLIWVMIFTLSLVAPASSVSAEMTGDKLVTFQGSFPDVPESPANARAEEADGKLYDINAVVVTGDRVPVYSLPNWESYENDALYAPMSEADIEAFRVRLQKELSANGYMFATVAVYRPSLKLGFLKMRVHVGEKGDVTVSGNRWYSAEQILNSVEWKTGNPFNYRSLYSDLFELNVQPSMRVQTELMPRIDKDGKRVVDIAFEVEDRFPVLMAWNIANVGSRETSDWRSRATAQFLNLSQNDDVLTFEWLTDPFDVSDINATTLSYYRPVNEEWGFNFNIGYSASDLYDVIPEFDVFGQGTFVGAQFQTKLRDNEDYSVDFSFGWLFQETKNVNIVTIKDEDTGEYYREVEGRRRVTMSMPRFTIGYAAKKFDSLGGRNFASATFMFNFEGLLGSHLAYNYNSEDPNANESFSPQNPGARSNLFIGRFKVARFQRLGGENTSGGNWSLFARADAQITNQAVPSSLYISSGGASTVRGYNEREATGDYGFNTTLELRSPLFENFIPNFTRDEEYLRDNPDDWAMHRVQFVFFYDAGWVAYHDQIKGLPDATWMNSLGLGMRMGFTKYSQLKFDYGYPLEKHETTPKNGSLHFSLQLQY